MYCPNCGENNSENAKFCPFCGAKIMPYGENSGQVYTTQPEPAYGVQPETVYAPGPGNAYHPAYVTAGFEEQKANQPDSLIFSIIAAVLSRTVAVAGIVMGIIGIIKARKNAAGEPVRGKNKVGFILSIVAVVLGSIGVLELVVYVICILAGALGDVSHGIKAAVSCLGILSLM